MQALHSNRPPLLRFSSDRRTIAVAVDAGRLLTGVGMRIATTAETFTRIPVGTPHSFRNKSPRQARLLISQAPAWLEQMLFELALPVISGGHAVLHDGSRHRLPAAMTRDGVEIRLPSN
jgi:hypothetical protein